MIIKWCPDIFKKQKYSKCHICDDFYSSPVGRKCFGIFYIFYRIRVRVGCFISYRILFIKRLFKKNNDDMPF